MSRETSPYAVGDYWLDKRRDGKSPYWQIASYKPATRQIIYRSTHKQLLDDAKPVIHAYVESERAKGRQEPSEARVIPLLLTYWQEKGQHVINSIQAATSIRAFIGFLMQDSAGMNAVVTDMTPVLLDRFRAWRMAPHSYSVQWGGQEFPVTSQGVAGATVDRHLNDIRAGLNHAEANMRIPYAPTVPALAQKYRSTPRDRVLTYQELGLIAWYCYHSPDLFRYFALLLGTGQRPIAVNAFRPSQYDERFQLIDMQPEALPQTKKRNAIIPAIRPLRPVLKAWQGEPVKSRKTAWRIMRRNLGLEADIIPYTIRHTVATLLYNDDNVPDRQVSELLGHDGNLKRTTKRYAKYNPALLKEAERALSNIWLRVSREARKVGAVQLLSKDKFHGKLKIVLRTPKG